MWLGIDIGTSSAKAVIVDDGGHVMATITRPHTTKSPRPGWFEHDPQSDWWKAIVELCGAIRQASPSAFAAIGAMSVSGIGPCTLITDADDRPLAPAILYGIDVRATEEIATITQELGDDEIIARAGNSLSTQSVLPKLRWTQRHRVDAFAAARRWHCCSTWLTARLTGRYVCDHQTASVASPLYDVAAQAWWEDVWSMYLPSIERPVLVWPGDVVGTINPFAAAELDLGPDTTVVAGTIDAYAEAYGAGCDAVGDTMVMYGSTLFLITSTATPIRSRSLWSAAGRRPQTWAAAAGLATGGLAASWMASTTRRPLVELAAAAKAVSAGSDGLIVLPYFAGERTPLLDPRARGCILGLTLDHSPEHLLRATFEGVAFAVRHNLDAMVAAGASPRRLVAVGGGTVDDVWPQIVSSVTGLHHDVPAVTLGASFGGARAAADASGIATTDWNPVSRTLRPDGASRALYDDRYQLYLGLYPKLVEEMHALAWEIA